MKKLVVITGASSGFGMALAKEFAKDDYPMLLLARRVEKMEALNLPNAMCRKVDVTNKDEFESAVREAEAKYGKTDLIVNNAGVMLLGSVTTQDSMEWKKMLDVNVLGVLNGMQIVVNDMKERKSGTIINISSIAGLNPYENHAGYCASKYAVTGMTDTIRAELSASNVRVVSICPGAVATELIGHTTKQELIDGYNEWKESAGATSITARDVATTIKFAYQMPQGVCLRRIVICDTKQEA